MKHLLAASLFLFASCSSQKIVSSSHDRLFPYGNYYHRVSLTLPDRSFDFASVVQLKPDAIHVVVLSPFGTTAFKINEDLKSGDVQVEIDFPMMKRFEPKLREYYHILREVLLATSPKDLESNKSLQIKHFDENGIPTEFHMEGPNFKVDVKVTSYEI